MTRRSRPWIPAALAELGVLLLLVGVTALSLHGCGSAGKERVLVLGWGGATWKIIEPLLATDALPNIKALIARGTTAELESIRPPESAAAWVSLSTGAHPGETGIADWAATRSDTVELHLNTSEQVHAPFVWERLAGTGKRAFVFGAPLAAPARPVDGVLVAGSPVESEESWTHPAELRADLERHGILRDPTGIVTPREWTIESFHEQLAKKRSFLLEHLGQSEWDLGWIVFPELDEMHRACWPGPNENELIAAYGALDSLLGELLELAGTETDVIVVSEHGTNLYTEIFGLNAMMMHEGYTGVNASVTPFYPSKDASQFENRNGEYMHRLSVREHQLTRATASTCAGNVGSVRLALEGMEAGAIPPFDLYDYVLRDLVERFEMTVSPRTMEKVIVSTTLTDELYPGEYADRNPNFMFEFSDEFLITNDLVLSKYRVLDPPQAGPSLQGVYIAAGPSFEHAEPRGSRSILDVAPEVLKLLGLAP